MSRKVQLFPDLLILTVGFLGAYLLCFEFAIPREELSDVVVQLLYVLLVQFATLATAVVYSFIWRHVGCASSGCSSTRSPATR